MKNILLLVALFFVSCNEDEESLIPQVDFNFQLLDMNGNPSTVFNEGENFIFSFLIINRSDRQIQFDQSEMQTQDFFRVIRLVDSQEEVSTVDMGRPYNGVFCLYMASHTISAKDTLSLRIPWKPDENWDTGTGKYFSPFFCDVNSDNQLLGKGNYQTKFSSRFEFSVNGNAFSLPSQDFNIGFTIQ